MAARRLQFLQNILPLVREDEVAIEVFERAGSSEDV
jgi:hypothetical protein